MKVCKCVVAFPDTNPYLLPYNRTDLTFDLEILILLISCSFLEFRLGRWLLKDAFASFI